MIKVVAKGILKSGVTVEEYLQQARELVSETRKEKGCISYALYEDINDPTVVTMLEEWEDEESLKNHLNSVHVMRIVPELKKLRESSELNVYKELE